MDNGKDDGASLGFVRGLDKACEIGFSDGYRDSVVINDGSNNGLCVAWS
jgi:hypothetical protein